VSRENTTGLRSDGRETREHIIECAGKIFARDGYYKATSKEICEAAGGEPGGSELSFRQPGRAV
jgi:AcrR family transcriptional regulator